MKRTKARHNPGSDSPEWYFLSEYPIDEEVKYTDNNGDHQPGLLFNMTNDIGMPPELVSNIQKYLTGFMKRLNVPGQEGESIAPTIRVYCHRKAMDELSIMRAASSNTDTGTYQPARGILGSTDGCRGSWGYFLVERAGNLQSTGNIARANFIDLYLYKEGG